MFNTTLKIDLAQHLLNNLILPGNIILLGYMDKETKREIFKFDEYDTDSITDIKQFELPELNGYTQGGIPITGLSVMSDEETNKVIVAANNITFYNNPLEPSTFEVYGFAVISDNSVVSTEIFQSSIHVLKDDFIISLPTTTINGNSQTYLFMID